MRGAAVRGRERPPRHLRPRGADSCGREKVRARDPAPFGINGINPRHFVGMDGNSREMAIIRSKGLVLVQMRLSGGHFDARMN
eukprot:2451018-Rhodomonas_salina.1